MITMAHGSGGKESNELIEGLFKKYFSNPYLEEMEDAAVIRLEGKVAYTTDSFVVTPLFFKGGDIGKLAVCGTVNDLLMQGAIPHYLTAGFIIEEGLDEKLLEKIVCSMALTAQSAGVQIVAGDTKVIEGKGGLYINTSGIGTIPERISLNAKNCKVGDKILLSGAIGDHHACILSSRMEIENGIQSDAQPLNELVKALMNEGIKVKAMRDITRGGLGTILNELSHKAGCGMQIEEKQLPIHEEVKGFCEILGLDPLYMGNEGKFVAIIGAEYADRALQILKNKQGGEEAALIGEIQQEKGVTLVTPLGARRKVAMLYGEGLPRIC